MNLLLLIAIYAIGILSDGLFAYLGLRLLKDRELHLASVNWKIALPVALVAMPVIGICMYLTTLDATLWLNREFGLGITGLADMYGPDGEILR